MRNLFLALFSLVSMATFAQQGTVTGLVQDKDMNLDPLPFVSVYVEGTSKGTTTDFDGKYTLQLEPGTYKIVYEFVGYKTEKKDIVIKAGVKQDMNVVLGSSADQLDAVVITAVVNKETEEALLVEQKEAVEIKESIGAEQLSKSGVSNAAAATAKITGVNKNESSGDVYIRGLGDRYLLTTMNGLPIPSDDIEKKNIDLKLFPTSVIQNVSITKAYSSESYADQSSGHVNISSKVYSRSNENLKVGLGVGTNTNVAGQFGDFKATANKQDFVLGFHSASEIEGQLLNQTWNTDQLSTPINYSFSLSGGKEFELGNSSIATFLSVSNSRSSSYRKGVFKNLDENQIKADFSDVERFKTVYNTTALFDAKLKIKDTDNNTIRLTSLFINKLTDNVLEAGRNSQGFVFDQDPAEYGAFVRDQNTKQTRILVNQLLGSHLLSETNTLKWALGFNVVNADEPNRIRNEVNIGGALNPNQPNTAPLVPEGFVQFAHVSPFQSRKSRQEISDIEFNGTIKDEINFISRDDQKLDLKIGGDFRLRSRDFESQFIGVRGLRNQRTDQSIDNLSAFFTQDKFDSGLLSIPFSDPDLYDGNLNIVAGFANGTYKFNNTTLGLGIRYELDNYDLNWDVEGYRDPITGVTRAGSLNDSYSNVLPNINIKQQLNDKHSLRLAASKTITLPEFKELTPFQYVSPTGRVTQGNPELSPSTNYNVDFKWEFFPTKYQLLSVTTFYKQILDPINFSVLPSAAGTFSYANTGDQATVVGIEAETKLDLINNEDFGNLKLNFNITLMDHKQDLSENFQFANETETKLSGASNVITNFGLSFSDEKEFPLNATINANYASDRIYALGAPRDQEDKDVNYNDEIIEIGFVTLDIILSKKINENWSLKGSFKNILNPVIKQTQDLGRREVVNGEEVITSVTNQTVQSYRRGSDLGVSVSYTF